MSNVVYFTSTMSGAPTLTNTAGSLIGILDACLVDGLGSVTLDSLVVAHIYAVAVLEGALHVFFNIAETAALPRVVALRQLPQATAQNQAGFATASIVGPALGSWLYQAVGRGFPFVVDAASHTSRRLLTR